MATAKRFRLHAADGTVLGEYARRDRAVQEYEINAQSVYVTAPSGIVVHGTAPATPKAATPAADNTDEESKMTDDSTTKVKAKREAAKGGCSLRRLGGWATKNGYEVVNGTRTPEGYTIDLVAPDGVQTTYSGPTAREAYGAAHNVIKASTAEEREAKAAERTAAKAAKAEATEEAKAKRAAEKMAVAEAAKEAKAAAKAAKDAEAAPAE